MMLCDTDIDREIEDLKRKLPLTFLRNIVDERKRKHKRYAALERSLQIEFAAELRGIPWAQWHVADDVLVTHSDVDPTWSSAPAAATFTKVCPDNTVLITPEPSSDWTEMYLGAEYISENAGQPMQLKRGYTFWKEWVTQPSCIELIALMNAIPLLYVPKVVQFATAAGF